MAYSRLWKGQQRGPTPQTGHLQAQGSWSTSVSKQSILYPVSAVDVGPVACQELHHVRLVAKHCNVQGGVVGDWV